MHKLWITYVIMASFFCFADGIQVAFGQELTPRTLQNGVIVLKDGRLFEGTVENAAGGYRITTNRTSAILPFDRVDVTATSKNQAYEALRDRVLKPTANDHLQLAEWCLKNDLIGQARTEVAKALTLEPLRVEARLMLEQIDKKVNPEKDHITVPSQNAMTIGSFLREGERTAGGLTRESQQQFIRTIQPLLINKCGNAYCHGTAAQNSFRLTPVQRGHSGNRLQSADNLEQVLTQINLQQPDKSNLLWKPTSVDQVHRKVFLGKAGQSQYQILHDWIIQISQESGAKPDRAVNELRSSNSGHQVQLTAGQTTGGSNEIESANQRLLDQVSAESQHDPFDPEIFNRRVHGMTAAEMKSKRETNIDSLDQ